MQNDQRNIEKLDFETIEHEKIPFTLIHTKVIQTITDYFAGFIWVYLQSLPSDWKINKKHLQKHFCIGEDKLKKHMAYLNRTHLIEYVRTRDELGLLSEIKIRVLNGTDFNENNTSSTGVKTTPLVTSSTGVIIHPVVDHTSGFYPPLTNTIYITNNNKEKQKEILCENVQKKSDWDFHTAHHEIATVNQTAITIRLEAEESFESFWTLYPVKKNKARAKAAWICQNCHSNAPAIIEKLIEQIQKDKQYLEGFASNPDKYIMQEKWTDEVQVRKSNGNGKSNGLVLDHNSTSWADGIHEDLF